MGFLGRLFKRKKKPNDIFKVVITTEKNLSAEKVNAIERIVKEGIKSKSERSDIVVKIMISTGIYDRIILKEFSNGVEVIL